MSAKSLPSPVELFPQARDLLNPVRQRSMPDEWNNHECDVCVDKKTGEKYVVVGGEEEWKAHFRSRRHRQKERRIRKSEEWEKWKALQGESESGESVRGKDGSK